jgi:RNA polymerase sigma-70 factor (ECF subfamily)
MIRAEAIADGAWQELTSALKSYIGRRVANRDDRDDLVQDVLLRVHRGLGTLKDQAGAGPWIYSIANRTLIDHWRRKGRRGPAPVELSEDDLVETREPFDTDQLQHTLAAYVANRIARLPSPYRETLTLTELQGMKYSDAAAMLETSVAAVKSRVLRGRTLLRQALGECCTLEIGPTGRVIDCIPPADNPNAETCATCATS